MILTTIAIIWVSVAAVFVLGLCMAAAKPVPQAAGWRQECADSSEMDETSEERAALEVRLYCGRSINLLNGRLSSLESAVEGLPAGQRGGLADFRKSDDPDRAVSF